MKQLKIFAALLSAKRWGNPLPMREMMTMARIETRRYSGSNSGNVNDSSNATSLSQSKFVPYSGIEL